MYELKSVHLGTYKNEFEFSDEYYMNPNEWIGFQCKYFLLKKTYFHTTATHFTWAHVTDFFDEPYTMSCTNKNIDTHAFQFTFSICAYLYILDT